jgi:hypothetical protein
MDMAGELEASSEVDETDGEAAADIGGVRGEIYCAGVACSTACNMIAI